MQYHAATCSDGGGRRAQQWASGSRQYAINKMFVFVVHTARKLGFICEENTSPKCQTPSNVRVGPLELVTTTNWFMTVDIPAVNMPRHHHL